eukprot:gene19509-26180_t
MRWVRNLRHGLAHGPQLVSWHSKTLPHGRGQRFRGFELQTPASNRGRARGQFAPRFSNHRASSIQSQTLALKSVSFRRTQMDPVEQVVELLQKLSGDLSDSPPSPSSTDALVISLEDVGSVRECSQLAASKPDLGIWQAAGQNGVSMVAVTKELGRLMSAGGKDAELAAILYSHLLRLPGSPASSLFDPYTFSSFMQTVKNMAAPASDNAQQQQQPSQAPAGGKATKPSRKGRKPANSDSEGDSDMEDVVEEGDQPVQGARANGGGLDPQCCLEGLDNLRSFLQVFPLKEHGEMGSLILETMVDLTRFCSPVPRPSNRGSASGSVSKAAFLTLHSLVLPQPSNRGSASRSVSEAAFLTLHSLVLPQHGDVPTTAATCILRLLPALMGVATASGSGRAAAGAAANRKSAAQEVAHRRGAALSLIKSMCSDYPDEVAELPLRALIKQLCLRASDKADARAQAFNAAVELTQLLPPASNTLDYPEEVAELPLRALIKQLCLRAPDKADARAQAVSAAVELTGLLPPHGQLELVYFVHRMSRSSKAQAVSAAVELTGLLPPHGQPELVPFVHRMSRSSKVQAVSAAVDLTRLLPPHGQLELVYFVHCMSGPSKAQAVSAAVELTRLLPPHGQPELVPFVHRMSRSSKAQAVSAAVDLTRLLPPHGQLELVYFVHCMSGPSKAQAVSAAVELTGLLPPHGQPELVPFVHRMSRSSKAQAVSAAVDLTRLLPPHGQLELVYFVHRMSGPSKAQAVSAAVDLTRLLPPHGQLELVYFVHCMSGPSKLSLRLVSVEMSHSLMMGLPAPFALDAGYQSFVDGSHSPGDLLVAPWSAVCLTILVQRAQDKGAGVRAKAMSHLGDAVEAFTSLLSADAGSEAHAVAAVEGASSKGKTKKATTKRSSRSKRGAAGADDDAMDVESTSLEGADAERDEEDGSDADEAADAEGEDEEEEKFVAVLPSSIQLDGKDEEGSDADEADDADGAEMDEDDVQEEEKFVAVLPSNIQLDLTPMLQLSHRRCRDDKAAVRKAALQLLEGLLMLKGGLPEPMRGPPGPQDILVVEAATADSLLSVRKGALSAASHLVAHFPFEPSVCELWARCALPLVRDPEVSIQGPRGHHPESAVHLRPLLAAIANMGRTASACINKALSMMSQRKTLKGKAVAKGLEAIIAGLASDEASGTHTSGTQQHQQQQLQQERLPVLGAWMVLEQVAAYEPSAPSWQFLQGCWRMLQKGRSKGGDTGGADQGAAAGVVMRGEEGAHLLWVISHAASKFPVEDAAKLSKDLLKALLAFNLPPSAAAAHVAALHRLSQAQQDPSVKSKDSHKTEWCSSVMEAVLQLLTKCTDEGQQHGNSGSMDRHCASALFCAGEVALLKQTQTPSSLLVRVQALLAVGNGPKPAMATQNPEEGSQMLALVKAEGGEDGGGSCAAVHAWICLGKMCLVDEALAKKCVPLFVQELSRSSSHSVRNNILVALADMCVHFTALVDTYMPRLAACIRDPHELVRALAGYLLGDALATKAPLLAYNHFVEAVFALNDCQAGVYAGRMADSSHSLGTEAGGGSMARRDTIYHTLLRRMSPEHKFSSQAKLVAEVLGGVADGGLPLEECSEVLGDALRLLGSKEIKVSASRLAAADKDEMSSAMGASQATAECMAQVSASRLAAADEDEMSSAMGASQATAEGVARARGKLVSAMMKKHLVESVVPLLIELKHMLQEKRHPLLSQLMACMAGLLKDYKNEVEDILVADKHLAKEILFDMRLAEQAAKQPEAQPPMMVVAGSAAADLSTDPRPLGSLQGTPLAAEVLAQTAPSTAARARMSIGGRVNTPGAAAMAANGALTPGTALKSGSRVGLAAGGGDKTPFPPSAPGSAVRTPFSFGRPGGGGRGAAAAAALVSPAPMSAVKLRGKVVPPSAGAIKRASSLAEEETDGDDGAQQVVPLPSPAGNVQPLRQWNIQIDGPGAEGGAQPSGRQQGARANRREAAAGKGTKGQRGAQASVEASAKAVTQAATDGLEEDAKENMPSGMPNVVSDDERAEAGEERAVGGKKRSGGGWGAVSKKGAATAETGPVQPRDGLPPQAKRVPAVSTNRLGLAVGTTR